MTTFSSGNILSEEERGREGKKGKRRGGGGGRGGGAAAWDVAEDSDGMDIRPAAGGGGLEAKNPQVRAPPTTSTILQQDGP